MDRKQRSNSKMGRSSGRTQDVSFLQRISRNRWRSNWVRVAYFPRIFVVADSGKDQRRFEKKEHQTWRVHGPDHHHVNVQRHWLAKEREWWDLHLECTESEGWCDEILATTLDVFRSWVGQEVVWRIFLPSQRRIGLHCQWSGTGIQRNLSSCVQKYPGFESRNFEGRKDPKVFISMEIRQTQNSCSKQSIL